MKSSEKIDKLCEAMVKAQAEIKAPHLDSTGDTGKYKYRYASLGVVRDAIVPVFNRHALYVMQCPGSGERGPSLTTLIFHASGQWLELDDLVMPVQKQDAQGYGSALTYARRYALLAIAGVVADEDDDAEGASSLPKEGASRPPKAQPATKDAPEKTGPAMATIPQREAMVALKEQLKMSDEGFVNMLKTEFKCARTKELTGEQAERFLEMLRRQVPKEQKDLASGSAGTGVYGRDGGRL